MAQFVVMRVSEIPALGQPVSGTLVRVDDGGGGASGAIKAAAALLRDGNTNAVWGVVPQAQVTRYTSTPTNAPDWTVVQG